MYMLHAPSILSFLLTSRYSLYYVNISYVESEKVVRLPKLLSEYLQDVSQYISILYLDTRWTVGFDLFMLREMKSESVR
jgi:hypothetical protein